MIHFLVVLALALAACTPDSQPTTSTAVTVEPTSPTSTTNSVVTSTTELIAATTSEAEDLPDLDGITFPTDPETVDDIPAFLTAPIGRPPPDPNLAIDGPDDAERWVAEWVKWMAWVRANPQEGQASLEAGWLPDTPMVDDTLTGLIQSADRGVRNLGWPFNPVSVSGTFDDAFESLQVLRLVVVADGRVPTYTVDESGGVVEVSEPFDTQTTLRLILRPNEEEEWRVEAIETVG